MTTICGAYGLPRSVSISSFVLAPHTFPESLSAPQKMGYGVPPSSASEYTSGPCRPVASTKRPDESNDIDRITAPPGFPPKLSVLRYFDPLPYGEYTSVNPHVKPSVVQTFR